MKNTIESAISESLETYFRTLEDVLPRGVYELVLSQVEPAMLKTVMAYAQENQSEAARILSISRNTLRQLLKKYHL